MLQLLYFTLEVVDTLAEELAEEFYLDLGFYAKAELFYYVTASGAVDEQG